MTFLVKGLNQGLQFSVFIQFSVFVQLLFPVTTALVFGLQGERAVQGHLFVFVVSCPHNYLLQLFHAFVCIYNYLPP